MAYSRYRMRRLAFIGAVLAIAAVAMWLSISRGHPRTTGSWALTADGCFVPVGTPTVNAPGPICGTPQAVTSCIYRNQRYGIGEQFAARDGCNTCACGEGGQVSCSNLSRCVRPTAPDR